MEKLDGREFKGQRVNCVANVGVVLIISRSYPLNPALVWLTYHGHRPNRIPHHGTVPAPDPLAVGLTRLPPTTTTAEVLGEVVVTALPAAKAAIVMVTATAAPAGITTTTAPGTGPLPAAAPLWTTTRRLPHGLATTNHTAASIPPTRMLTAVRTIDPRHHGTSRRARALIPGRAAIPARATSAATGKSYYFHALYVGAGLDLMV